MSQWTNSKGIQEVVVCIGKDKRYYLAKGHIEHMSLELQEISGTLLWRNCIRDADGWPNLWCHTSEMEFFIELRQAENELATILTTDEIEEEMDETFNCCR